MISLLRKGLQHLRTHGVVLTTIAAALYIKGQLEPLYYTHQVAATADSVGKDLTVNGPSRVSVHTSLGDNVNFNGLRIEGGGEVTIGDNFHSGPGHRFCETIT